MPLHEKLNKYKEINGKTLNEIATLSGLSSSTISRIFTGQTESPTFEAMVSIAKALNISLDELAELPLRVKKCEYETALDVTINELKKSVDFKGEIITEKNTELKTKDKWIKALFFALIGIIILCLGVVVFDLSRGDVGYIRY